MDLSPPGADAGDAQVAVDSTGKATIVWSRGGSTDHRIEAGTIAADGTLGATTTLSTAGGDARHPQVVVDSSGQATVVWQLFDGTNLRVEARAIAADGTLGEIQTLSTDDVSAEGPQLAVDSTDEVTVVWSGSDDSRIAVIKSRTLASDGTLGAIRTLSRARGDARQPQVAVDSTDRAIVVWRRDRTTSRIQVGAIDTDGTPAETSTLSPDGVDAYDPQLAVGPTGQATVVWQSNDGTHDRVQARRVAPDGTRGSIRTLSRAGGDARQPQVAVDSTSEATVVWQRFDGIDQRVQSRTVDGDGMPGIIHTLSRTGGDAHQPQVGIDSTDRATVVWCRLFSADAARVETRSIAADGTRGTIQFLSAPDGNAAGAELAIDSSDRATVVWNRFDDADYRVQATQGP